ncbi:hypothetical protein HMI51_00390 [Corallococcus coralloides]|nr:hypothetical protein [Corallococcus coralloides]
MRSSRWFAPGVLGLLWATACGIPDAPPDVPEDTLVRLSRQALETTCEERNNALLQSLKSPLTARACTYDEDCPQGSFCNESTGQCDWSCLAGGPAGTGCATGHVCDCEGRCAAEGPEVPLELPGTLPRVDVTPGALSFATPASSAPFTAQRLVVGVAALNATEATKAANQPVRVVGGPGMEVACSVGDAPATVFASECTVSTWTFSDFGTGKRATVNVDVRPRSDSTLSRWYVTLEAARGTPRRTRVDAELLESSPGVGGVRPFHGTVTLAVDASADAGVDPIVLPVRGFANDTHLYLYDASRTLSPSGKLRLTSGTNRHGEEWLPSSSGSNTADAVTVDVEGGYDGSGASSPRLSGTFTMRLPRPVGSTWGVAARYQLSRLRVETATGVDDLPLTACPASACATGEVCEPDLGVCVPGVRAWSGVGATAPTNTVVSEERAAWDQEASSKLTEYLALDATLTPSRLARGILCHQGNPSSPQDVSGFPAAATVTAAQGLVRARSGDFLCANGGLPYEAELLNTWDRYPDTNGLKNPDRLTDLEMLSECMADLKRPVVSGPSLAAGPWFANRYGTRYAVLTQRASLSSPSRITPGRCFNLARFYGALHLSARESTSRDQRLAWRLFQQWIATHGYVAQQVVQQRELSAFLNETPPSDWDAVPALMARFEKGWDLLLDNAYAPLVPGNDATRTCSLLNPDYRLPPPPVASWMVNASQASVQDRGPGARWNRAKSTFFFHTPSLAANCTSTTSPVELAFASYAADGVASAPRSLQVTCLDRTDAWELTAVAARKKGLTGSSVSTWTWSVPRTTGALALAVVDRGTDWRRMDASGAYVAPSTVDIGFQHFSLVPPFRQKVSGTAGNRLAAWDFLVDDAQLQDAITQGTLYDAPAGDLSPLPGSQPQHDATAGLPALMLEGLTAHLRLLNEDLETTARTTLASCGPVSAGSVRDLALARFGRTLRYEVLVEAMARSAYARERAACTPAMGLGELSWDKRWRDAQAELEAVRRQAYEKLRALTDCTPYGMPLDEAPIAFGATPTGPIERYFGSSTYLHANAKGAVETAVATKVQAEAAWVNLRNSEVQEEFQGSMKDQRVLELQRQYGAPIVQMCGLTDVASEDVLARFDPARTAWPLSPATCFVKPECQQPASVIHSRVKTEHARFTLCTWRKLVASPADYTDAAVRALVEHYADATVAAGSGVVSWGGTTMPVAKLYGLPLPAKDLAPDALTAANTACLQELGTAGSQLPTASSLGYKLESSCYRGDMGAAVLTLIGANQSVQVAQSQWADAQERLRVARERCALLQEDTNTQLALSAAFEQQMHDLIAEKARVDRRVNNLSDINSKSDGIIGAFAQGGLAGAVWGGLKLLGGGAENRYKDQAIRVSEKISQAENTHRAQMEALQLQSNVRQCYAESNMYAVGIHTAALQVDQVETSVDAALLQLEGLEGRIHQLLMEGDQVVAREQDRQVPLFSHDFWLHEKLTAARDTFATAKRLSYLFARALEYEKQQSSAALGAILSAQGPLQLLGALNAYSFAVLDKTVYGRDVEAQTFVVTLRSGVFKLEDQVATVPGDRSLTKQERFTRRLLSPESAVYDDNGRYLGQGLRFTLRDGLGPNAIRCGEKVWTVHAHLSGDDRLTSWITTRGLAPLILRKRNTFSSHLCDPDHPGLQTRTLRPSLRSGGYTGTARPGEETTFTPVSVAASTGQEVLGFQQAPTGEGSTEWKGRGLYGEYEVIFPWVNLLTRDGVDTHFPLDGIVDVYLRFEQVSAATTHVYP